MMRTLASALWKKSQLMMMKLRKIKSQNRKSKRSITIAKPPRQQKQQPPNFLT